VRIDICQLQRALRSIGEPRPTARPQVRYRGYFHRHEPSAGTSESDPKETSTAPGSNLNIKCVCTNCRCAAWSAGGHSLFQ
jgi:hypothetical protein